jgi:hypothetical protein
VASSVTAQNLGAVPRLSRFSMGYLPLSNPSTLGHERYFSEPAILGFPPPTGSEV